MLFSKVVILATGLAFAGVWVQSDKTQCGPGFSWSKNSLGQDPCTVGSMLDASCRGLLSYSYPPLNASQSYLPPRTDHSGDLTCDCNAVMYNLYMACASCQGGEIYPWQQWILQCGNISVADYPVDIAQGTAIPRWAYDNVMLLPNMTYNGTVAISIGRDPEEHPKQISTVYTGSGSTMGISMSLSGLPNPSNAMKGRRNVRAIVGGVIGSIVSLIILAIVVFFYTKHRRQQEAQLQRQTVEIPDKQPMMSPYGDSTTSVFLTPYNPSDPSTFPRNLPDPVPHTTPSNLRSARRTYFGFGEV